MNKTYTYQRITGLIICVLLLMLVSLCHAQPDTLWTRQYGEPGISLYQAGLILTSDQGYLIHCTQNSSELTPDFRLMKLDSLGNVEWDRVFGGAMTENHSIVKQTSDGGYILVGYTSSYGAWVGVDWSALLMKIDSQGDSIWSRVYSYVNPSSPNLRHGLKPVDVVEAPDGGYTFVANMGGEIRTLEMWMVKTSDDGDSLWAYRHNDESFWVSSKTLDVTIDGCYVIGGECSSGVSLSCEDLATRDPCMMKFSSDGDNIWSYAYEGDGWLTTLVECTNGELILLNNECYPAPNDVRGIIVTRTDQLGQELWNRHFRLQPDVRTIGINSISNTHDNGILLCLEPYDWINFERWPWILKLSSDGDSLWSISFDNEIYYEPIFDIQQTQDGGYVALAQLFLEDNIRNPVLIRYGREPQSIGESNTSVPTDLKLKTFPNPFNPTTTISFDLPQQGMVKLNVFDVTGRQVATLVDSNLKAGQHSVMFDGRELASGIYFYRLQAGDYTQTQKMVLLK